MDPIQFMFQQLARMQWTDYIDIAIVALIIYRVLPLFSTPGTARIAKAVIAVVILAGLTEVAQLHTLSFIFKQFMAIGLLALVVLFQPELRRVLDHLGSVRWSAFFGSTKPMAEMENVILQTTLACETMSENKVGALIVFAREARLEEYCKTGTEIDGMVSEQLLRNIFFPKAALHDGAMVIRDGRVVAAGCVLPLSSSHRLSADLGTRHRAGVGMSEVSDAVVVIVSEETGVISVATDGMLKRNLTPHTLEKLLYQELVDGEDGQDKLTNRLRQTFHFVEKEQEDHEK